MKNTPEKKVKKRKARVKDNDENYINRQNNIGDFLIGLFGFWFYVYFFALSGGFEGFDIKILGLDLAIYILFIPPILVSFFLIKKREKYIFKGILTAVMIPVILFLLLLGACSILP